MWEGETHLLDTCILVLETLKRRGITWDRKRGSEGGGDEGGEDCECELHNDLGCGFVVEKGEIML